MKENHNIDFTDPVAVKQSSSPQCLMCGSRKYSYTHPVEGHWKFQGGGGSHNPKFLKASMKLNWNFWRGGVSR